MFCPECGANNPDMAKFCIECGVNLIKFRNEISHSAGNENKNSSNFAFEKKIEKNSFEEFINLIGIVTKVNGITQIQKSGHTIALRIIKINDGEGSITVSFFDEDVHFNIKEGDILQVSNGLKVNADFYPRGFGVNIIRPLSNFKVNPLLDTGFIEILRNEVRNNKNKTTLIKDIKNQGHVNLKGMVTKKIMFDTYDENGNSISIPLVKLVDQTGFVIVTFEREPDFKIYEGDYLRITDGYIDNESFLTTNELTVISKTDILTNFEVLPSDMDAMNYLEINEYIKNRKFSQIKDILPIDGFDNFIATVTHINPITEFYDDKNVLHKYRLITIDDGTASSQIRLFGSDMYSDIKVGDIIKLWDVYILKNNLISKGYQLNVSILTTEFEINPKDFSSEQLKIKTDSNTSVHGKTPDIESGKNESDEFKKEEYKLKWVECPRCGNLNISYRKICSICGEKFV